MNIKKITVVSVVSVALLGAGSAVVFAKGGWHKDGDCHQSYLSKKIGKKLDLNEDQFAQLDNLMVEFRDFRQMMFDGKAQARSEITALLNASEFDRDQALALMVETAQDKANLVAQEAPQLVEAMANFSDSLDAEQREELAELVEKRMGHRWHHKHHDGRES